MSPQNYETKKCPKCGHRAEFKLRTRKPGTGVGGRGAGERLPEPEYEPAWECESCGYYEAVHL